MEEQAGPVSVFVGLPQVKARQAVGQSEHQVAICQGGRRASCASQPGAGELLEGSGVSPGDPQLPASAGDTDDLPICENGGGDLDFFRVSPVDRAIAKSHAECLVSPEQVDRVSGHDRGGCAPALAGNIPQRQGSCRAELVGDQAELIIVGVQDGCISCDDRCRDSSAPGCPGDLSSLRIDTAEAFPIPVDEHVGVFAVSPTGRR